MDHHQNEIQETKRHGGRSFLVGVLTLAIVGTAGLMSSVAIAGDGSDAKGTCSAKAASSECGAEKAATAAKDSGCCPSEKAATAAKDSGCCPSEKAAKAAKGECTDGKATPAKLTQAVDKGDCSAKAAKGECADGKATPAVDKGTCSDGKATPAVDKGTCSDGKATPAKLTQAADGATCPLKAAKSGCDASKSGCDGKAAPAVLDQPEHVTFQKVAAFIERLNSERPARGDDATELARAASSEVEDEISAKDRGCCPSKK
jgi:hypothetical protein